VEAVEAEVAVVEEAAGVEEVRVVWLHHVNGGRARYPSSMMKKRRFVYTMSEGGGIHPRRSQPIIKSRRTWPC
jgi:hypothetical protein